MYGESSFANMNGATMNAMTCIPVVFNLVASAIFDFLGVIVAASAALLQQVCSNFAFGASDVAIIINFVLDTAVIL